MLKLVGLFLIASLSQGWTSQAVKADDFFAGGIAIYAQSLPDSTDIKLIESFHFQSRGEFENIKTMNWLVCILSNSFSQRYVDEVKAVNIYLEASDERHNAEHYNQGEFAVILRALALFPNLEYLTINGLSGMKAIPDVFEGFKKLESVDFRNRLLLSAPPTLKTLGCQRIGFVN